MRLPAPDQPVKVPGCGTLDRRCNTCLGDGQVYHPEWQAYGAAVADAVDEHGVDDASELALADLPPEPDVPEEMRCPDCGGIGWLATIPGQALLIFLERHRPGWAR